MSNPGALHRDEQFQAITDPFPFHLIHKRQGGRFQNRLTPKEKPCGDATRKFARVQGWRSW